MSRPTNTLRGARMAMLQAVDVLAQPDLFDERSDLDTWREIQRIAWEVIQEETLCAEQRGAYAC